MKKIIAIALLALTLSPADPEYIVTVPLFDRVSFRLGDGNSFNIRRIGEGETIRSITVGGRRLKGWFVQHGDLEAGKELVVRVR